MWPAPITRLPSMTQSLDEKKNLAGAVDISALTNDIVIPRSGGPNPSGATAFLPYPFHDSNVRPLPSEGSARWDLYSGRKATCSSDGWNFTRLSSKLSHRYP